MCEAHEAIPPCFPDLIEFPVDAVRGRGCNPCTQPVAYAEDVPAPGEGRELGHDNIDIFTLFGGGFSLLTRGTV